MGIGDPAGTERIGALWVERDKSHQPVRVRFKWRVPGQAHDWFNIYIYDLAAEPDKNQAPAGYIQYANTGDPGDTGTSNEGEASFPLAGVASLTWSVLIEGCDPTYFETLWRQDQDRTRVQDKRSPAPLGQCRAGTRTTVQLPRRTAKESGRGVDHIPLERGGRGVLMQIGSCQPSSVYGLFVYVWDKPCNGYCPSGASNFGFVVVAPSRGWTFEEFKKAIVDRFRNTAPMYAPPEAHPIVVPISPPVTKNPDGSWTTIGPPSSHTVTFQWGAGGQLILDDTGAPGFYTADASTITANAHVSAPDTALGWRFNPQLRIWLLYRRWSADSNYP